MDIDIFIPCIIDQLYPETGLNMVKLLEKLDINVNYNSNQTCCGQMAFNGGYWDEAKSLGEKFIQDFSRGRMVVGLSASCINTVKNDYPILFHNTSMHIELKNLQKNIFEITDFLVNKLNITNFGAAFPHKVFIHNHNSSDKGLNLNKEFNCLLEKVKDIEITNPNETNLGCGIGGNLALTNENVSTAMAQQVVDAAIKSGAEYITSGEAECLLQLDSYIKKSKLNIKTINIVDILATGW